MSAFFKHYWKSIRINHWNKINKQDNTKCCGNGCKWCIYDDNSNAYVENSLDTTSTFHL